MVQEEQLTPETEAVSPEEFAQVMEGRSQVYAFLSNALLKEFTVEQIEQLKTMGVPDTESALVKESFAKIRRYLSMGLGPDPRTDLAVDYARVFLSAGTYDGLTAEPYESVFTSEAQIMMQEARDEVVHIYRENHMDIDPELHMPEDHLGYELEFLSVLAERSAAAARDEGLESETLFALITTQKEFIDAHILNWIDPLIEKVDEFARLPLYPAIIRIVKGYAQEDTAMLGELLAEEQE